MGECAPAPTTGFGDVARPTGRCVAVSPLSGSEYSLAVGVWLALWGQREWTEKKLNGNGGPHVS